MEWDGIDRRRFIRRQFPFTTHIYAPGKLEISTYTADFSEEGIRVVIKQELEAGSTIDLQIYTKKKAIICKGLVARVEKKESDYFKEEIFFEVGIQFQKIKEEDKEIVKEYVNEIKKMRKKYTSEK